MKPSPCRVLFLCTGNSARSIIAESLLNQRGEGRFVAYSAGSFPTGKVNPYALAVLAAHGHATAGLRSKSWDEFATDGAPRIDLVFTVCANAAGETCPVWPGHPVTAHWGIPDPAAAGGADSAKRQAFETAFRRLAARVDALLASPLDVLDGAALIERLTSIGRIDADQYGDHST